MTVPPTIGRVRRYTANDGCPLCGRQVCADATHDPYPSLSTRPVMTMPPSPAARRTARWLSRLRWLGAAFLVGLALFFGHAYGELRQALVWIGFAVVCVLAVVQPWQRR